jgi:hypothetical protein
MRVNYDEERVKHEETLTTIALVGAVTFPGTSDDHLGWMPRADIE